MGFDIEFLQLIILDNPAVTYGLPFSTFLIVIKNK